MNDTAPAGRPNLFAGALFDRCAERRRNGEWLAGALSSDQACFVPLWREHHLVDEDSARAAVLLDRSQAGRFDPAAREWVFLGEFRGRPCFAFDAGDEADDAETLRMHGALHGIRKIAPLVPADEAALLAYARAMLLWHRAQQFCGRCGARTRSREGGHLRVCSDSDCAQPQFPRMDPAIIVLVERGDACLLGRQRGWPEGVYSTIAGFVEPGESLEDAVAREVAEETDVRVEDVRYHSSQPWPFPSSIMLGFGARAVSSQIHCRDAELEDARWFTRADIDRHIVEAERGLPTDFSIAFRLISDWYDADRPGRLATRLREPA